ncbi:flagellar hook-associated protein FlgL [Bacillus sp. EB106-08-02-XG196]|jgi:flagellar hook-associated protein 3 FlgL|uniref:flagellar hook-associated protein FlgL n=1 Tax=Bacillus sp. EB106-08-02-XG196 TaxID=2737049 RepID=UPI0015C44996|nr:flagellar hook-associated protein FlgL [Bacillus sp. EB106-08-02-XG196]NWQ39682.1 flagellar hook-associated protein FlgL [Bacillus sp. EB106-08-02-XG196]
MRVTQQMISQKFIQNLHHSNKSMETLHGQISSGKKYERISDQPGEVLKGLSYRSSLSQIEQYQKNVEDGISWSSAMDGELGNVTNVLHRVRELTLQASNDTNNPSDRKNIAVEVRSLIDQVGNIANTAYGSGYLFSGTDLNTQPYQNGALQPSNTIVKEWNVGQGLSVKGNVHASSVFGFSADGKNLFETIEVVAQTLENGENPGSLLNSIDQQLDHVITQRTIVGINQNMLELASNKLEQSQLLNKKMLSTVEDTDISKAFTELSSQETLLQASLSAGGKILQQSLADFLR